MKISGQSFLLTGGNGFVGAHVVQRLLAEGAERIIVYDKVADGNRCLSKTDRRIRVIQGDITDVDRLREALTGVQGVFHLAVLPLMACEQDPVQALEVNVRGTFAVIQAAIAAGVEKLIYSSASSVYGDTLDVMDEQHPFNPWTMYGVTKLCGEFLLRPFHAKLSYVILRYMNIYGPGQVGGLIPAVIGKIRTNQPPVINGDGSASFDFLHVRDVAECTVLAMASDVTKESFNVGSGTEATVKDIVSLLIKLSGSSVSPIYKADGPVSMMRRVGSNEKAKRLLGFRPTISLQDGLEELLRG